MPQEVTIGRLARWSIRGSSIAIARSIFDFWSWDRIKWPLRSDDGFRLAFSDHSIEFRVARRLLKTPWFTSVDLIHSGQLNGMSSLWRFGPKYGIAATTAILAPCCAWLGGHVREQKLWGTTPLKWGRGLLSLLKQWKYRLVNPVLLPWALFWSNMDRKNYR